MSLYAKMANRAYNPDLSVVRCVYIQSNCAMEGSWKKKASFLELEGNGLRKLKDVT
jgi:hypothetical protein